jgi:hypothetical protein
MAFYYLISPYYRDYYVFTTRSRKPSWQLMLDPNISRPLIKPPSALQENSYKGVIGAFFYLRA